MTPKVAKCLIRYVEEADFPRLEAIYSEHEGVSVPFGCFEDFREVIRSEEIIYLVAEVNGLVVGGGGISDYLPGSHASLVFGVVARSECRKGYGTTILLARLMYIDPGPAGCQVGLEATEWSTEFFSRLGFKWQHRDEDEIGNQFLHGTHMLFPGDRRFFRRILDAGEVVFAQEIEDQINAESDHLVE